MTALQAFWKKYRKWILFGMIAVTLCYIMIHIPHVFAGVTNYKHFKEKFDQTMTGFSTSSLQIMSSAYQEFTTIMTDNSKFGAITALQDVVMVIGQSLVVVFFLVQIVKLSMQNGELTWTHWAQIFVRGSVAVVMVGISVTMLGYLYKVGGTVVTAAEQQYATSASVTANTDSQKAFKNSDSQIYKNFKQGIENAPLVGESFKTAEKQESAEKDFYSLVDADNLLNLMRIVIYLPSLVCVYLLFAAIFELKIRQIFSPIAVASFAYDEGRGAGVRYFKKYLSCMLKIAIYFFVAWLGNALMVYFMDQLGKQTRSETMTIYVILVLLSNVVAAISMMQMGSLSDEIIGV